MPRACKRHPLKSVAVNFPKFKVKHFSHATLRRMPLAIMPAILYISYLSSSGSPWTHFGTYISTPTFGRGLHAFQASTAMHPDDYRVCPKSRNGYMLPFFCAEPAGLPSMHSTPVGRSLCVLTSQHIPYNVVPP